MGCVVSRIERVERVRVCRERKRLMKHLLGFRHEFANSQLAYLRSLKNTGATLRQFTESESLELEETASNTGYPPSPPPPPPPLPPSPPPPPTFSPDLRRKDKRPLPSQSSVEEIEEVDEDGADSPPPPIPSSSWEYWDPFASPMPQCQKRSESEQFEEEESWADAYTEFLEDDEEADSVGPDEVNMIQRKRQIVQFVNDNDNDNSSTTSLCAKDDADFAMVVYRGKKTLPGIVKDLDEYFLKASAVVKDIAVFIDIDCGGTFAYEVEDNKKKRSNSAKVFSALTWSWSSRSLPYARETEAFSGSGEPCKPGAHSITLQKLYSVEQKLHKYLKEEEIARVEHGRKTLLLQRQEEEHELSKAEKTRATVESLRSCILSLQESISRSYSTILTLINEELQPQLIKLASGLMQMWQMMHNSHQVQLEISQQLHRLDQESIEPTSEYRRQAAAQLQTEVTSWYRSFCKLVKFQREYVRTLYKWTELTKCLDDIGSPGNSSTVRALTGKWMQALDKLPDKMVSEAINGLLLAVSAVVLQQQEEYSLRKRSDRLAMKLERELILLSEIETKFAGMFSPEDEISISTAKHPLLSRRTKVEALKKLVDNEKAKYASSIKLTRTMILNNLVTSLPKVFESLRVYSSAYVHCFEAILSNESMSEGEEMQFMDSGIQAA